MLRKTCASIVLALCFQHTYGTEAPISAVTLYPGSATVERTSHVTPGMTQIEIDGLPANFDTQTIRVQADPGIQIGQVVTRDIGRAVSASAREAELEARIQALQDQAALLEVDAKAAVLVQKYLENLGSAGATGDRQQPLVDAKSMAAMIDAIRRGGSDAFERMHKSELQKREINKQIEALQRDLAKLRSGARDARQVTVQLAARQAGMLKVSYQVNNAGWKPSYRAFLDSADSSVLLERMASVSQKTGEDWSGVKLKLSTGQPRLSPQAPEPRPWLLTYRKPTPPQAEAFGAFAPMPAPAPAPAGRQRLAKPSEDTADNTIPPIVETQAAFTTEFDVPSRVTLPADGREISVALSKQTMPVKQRLRTAPRLEKSAVVTAEAVRPEGVWLPGAIQLFRDGSFVGTTRWDTQATDKFMFSFGRDDLIRISVDRSKEQTGKTGLLANPERTIADGYTITSFHKRPVELLVLESSPVSTSEEVKVQTSFQPEPTIEAWEKRRGVVGWETVIEPKQTLKFNVDYTITYPKEGTVSGLP